jgi:hypothetical protein
MRAALSVVLSVLLALLPVMTTAAPSTGVVQGTVTISGQPVDGVEVALVDIASGAIHRAKSAKGGTFKVSVPAGQYVVANRSTAGLAIGHAPAVLAVEGGKVASTQIDLVALSVPLPQPPPPQVPPSPAPAGALEVAFDPVITCIVAGEHPIIDTVVRPPEKLARARLYFKSGASNEWYYGEGTHLTPAAVKEAEAAGAPARESTPPEGVVRFWLPKPTVRATPITMNVLVTTPDLIESRTPDLVVKVVEKESDCEGKVAPFGIPPEGLTFFSATTGAAVSAAVLGAGGLVLGVGAIVALIALVGATAVVAATRGTPEPATAPTTAPTPPPPVGTPTPAVDVCAVPGACPAGDECRVVAGRPVCIPPPTPTPSALPPCECPTPGITCTIGPPNPFSPSPSPCAP